MRRVLALACLLLLPTAAQASIASVVLIPATASGDTNSVTTAGVDTTGANLLVVVVSDYEAVTATAISDSKMNSWTCLTEHKTAGSARVRICYASPSNVGAAHTFTATGTGAFPSIVGRAFSGAASSTPKDQDTGAAFATGGGTTVTIGTITPGFANEVIVAAAGFNSSTATTLTIDGGFNTVDKKMFAAGVNFGVGMSYLIQTSIAAAGPTLTWDVNGDDGGDAIASFKVAGGGAATTTSGLTLLGVGGP